MLLLLLQLLLSLLLVVSLDRNHELVQLSKFLICFGSVTLVLELCHASCSCHESEGVSSRARGELVREGGTDRGVDECGHR